MNYLLKMGKDSDTEFHNLFYNKLHNGWDELINVYEKFIEGNFTLFRVR